MDNIGLEIHKFAQQLWPLNRSLTGEGVRNTLNLIKQHLPDLNLQSIPSGSQVFDWTIPKEWKVNEAYIITPSGDRICDFKVNNLHLVGYSHGFVGKIPLEQLKDHIHTLPDQPDAIPYVTSYYAERWGFCMSHVDFQNLKDGIYSVYIDATLEDGFLNFADLHIPGRKKAEIFLSTYICHPSMANNEISGIVVATFLAKWLLKMKSNEYSYRFVFLPETIGSIGYLSQNLEKLKSKVKAGFNITCVGDERSYSFLPSRNGNTISDRIALHVLKWTDESFVKYSWLDRGSDERQYCSPGVDLPIASIMRTKYGEYPEYHTSLDNLNNVVTPNGLSGGYYAIKRAIEAIENNKTYTSNVLCEPQMGKRGLYPTLSEKTGVKPARTLMDLLSYCDGEKSLLDIAELINVPIWTLYDQVDVLHNNGLIIQVESN